MCFSVKLMRITSGNYDGISMVINLQFQNKLGALRYENSSFIIIDALTLLHSRCLLTRSPDLWFLSRFFDEITHALVKGFVIDNTFAPYTWHHCPFRV